MTTIDNITDHWSLNLPSKACQSAKDWARTQPDLATAWKTCTRGDWMMWLLGYLSGLPGSDARRKLVLCACDCAETSAYLVDSSVRPSFDRCLSVARDWARGGTSTLDDVRSAAVASASASVASAADTAYASAAFAAYAAGDTAFAAADVVRKHYPEPPELTRKEITK